MIKRVFILLLSFTLATALYAQDGNFTASAPARVQVGHQFQYVVKGNEKVNVELGKIDGLQVLNGPFPSYFSSTQWVNGKMRAETTASYTYIMRFTKEGSFTIPPAIIKHKKDSYKTNSVDITVIGASTASNASSANVQQTSSSGTNAQQTSNNISPVFLKVIPSKRNLYKGEQFVCELKVFTSVNTRPTQGLKEVPYEGFYKHPLEADQGSSREIINGTEYVTQVLQRHVLIPQKSGKLVIDAFDSEWTIPQKVNRQRSRSMFDDPFFGGGYQNVPVLISSKPVTINVKPLPSGAPKSFTGGVGNLKMSAKLSSDKLVVNDALSLKLTISGTGNIALIGTPKIDFPPDHDVYETTKSLNVNTSGNRVSGSVVFEYPIVVRHAGSFRIAPLKFSWFDPISESYKTITSEEFAFVVEKGEGDNDEDHIYISGLRGEEVENIGTDILDISRNVPQFEKIKASPLSNFAYWFAYIIAIILFALTLIILRKYYIRKADIRLTKNRRANKMARSRLKLADKARKAKDEALFFEETEKALWGYLADKLSIERSLLSRDNVVEILIKSEISEQIQTELSRIIDACEFSRYAPSSEKSSMDKLYKDAAELINSLEQNIKTR